MLGYGRGKFSVRSHRGGVDEIHGHHESFKHGDFIFAGDSEEIFREALASAHYDSGSALAGEVLKAFLRVSVAQIAQMGALREAGDLRAGEREILVEPDLRADEFHLKFGSAAPVEITDREAGRLPWFCPCARCGQGARAEDDALLRCRVRTEKGSSSI